MSLPRPASQPVTLAPVTRNHRAVLLNVGQLFRHDMSESYAHLPNADGTFNDRMTDLFLAGRDPGSRGWLIEAAGRLGGYALTRPWERGGTSMAAFFVVRALRRTGVGRRAAELVLAEQPGPRGIAFQDYNPGARQFWERVATDAVGDGWVSYDAEPVDGRPPDSWLTFDTS